MLISLRLWLYDIIPTDVILYTIIQILYTIIIILYWYRYILRNPWSPPPSARFCNNSYCNLIAVVINLIAIVINSYCNLIAIVIIAMVINNHCNVIAIVTIVIVSIAIVITMLISLRLYVCNKATTNVILYRYYNINTIYNHYNTIFISSPPPSARSWARTRTPPASYYINYHMT